MTGHFITFEGIDGAGKSTQMRLLKSRLAQLPSNHPIVTTREPGGTPAGEEIRRHLLRAHGNDINPMSTVLLFNAARCELIDKVIGPAILRGDWVLSDRFFDSTVAYQGYGAGIELDFIRVIQDIVVGDIMPSLTIILDLEVAIGRSRVIEQKKGNELDRYEATDYAFMGRVRAGYQKIAAQYPSRCVLVPASFNDPKVIAEHVWRIVEQRLL